MHATRPLRRPRSLLLASIALLVVGCSGSDGRDGAPGPEGPAGPPGPEGPPGETTPPDTAVEGCVGCHGDGQVLPVGAIGNRLDAHFTDTNPDGPLSSSGIRRLDATLTQVDVTGTSVVIDFDAADETGAGFDELFASDGRFAIVRLDSAVNGDPSEWVPIGDRLTENFSSPGFVNLGGGAYRYTSSYDPTGSVMTGDTIRVAIQLSASDIPAENAWCDFDASLAAPNDCVSPVTRTRDIVQTGTCNVCHGPTNDTRLVFHGARTEVEYCVTCHNPDAFPPDMTVMIHKIHAGSALANGFSIYSDVRFPKDLDYCAACHTGGGVDEVNWKTQPNRDSCGSCHDDVDFDSGANHGVQPDNTLCADCHPVDGPLTPDSLPVETVHLGAARNAEGGTYRGGVNGYSIEAIRYDPSPDDPSAARVITDYSVTRNNTRMTLESDPEWTSGGRLTLRLGSNTSEYTNTGSGGTPAQPISVNALDVGGAVTALGGGVYRAMLDPSFGSDTVTVTLEGRPVADLDGDGSLGDRIPVAATFANIDIEGGRSSTEPRRATVDAALCSQCHDSGGAGLSLHGSGRTQENLLCAVCHNADATDINQRTGADPDDITDGKREEAIDFKRMVHQIHQGRNLQNGLLIFGFGKRPHDFGTGKFVGNLANCETCHVPDSYSTEDAAAARPTTIDTGQDAEIPTDDLNISPTAAVCASCHDDDVARDHMELNGASFSALDENTH